MRRHSGIAPLTPERTIALCYTGSYMTALTVFAAKYLIGASVALALAYGLLTRRKREFWGYAAAVIVTSYALALIAGALYSHPQPFVALGTDPLVEHAVDNSFPSHHVLFAAAFAASVTPFHLPLAGVLWLFALLIGAARVVAPLHYPIDIIASFIIVAVSALLLWRARKVIT